MVFGGFWLVVESFVGFNGGFEGLMVEFQEFRFNGWCFFLHGF